MRRLLLPLVVALALLVAAPTAYADTWRHTDAARDVLVDPYDDSDPPDLAATPGRGDLTRLTVRYDADALQVASSMRNQYCGHLWALRVVTSRGDTFDLTRGIAASEGCFASYVRSRRNGYNFRCEGLTVQRTPAGIVARVPRTCLGSPYRVRIGLELSTEDDSEAGAQTYDDVFRTAKVTHRKPRLGPWVVGNASAS